MAKGRSPSYPAIGLKEAIDKVRMVYAKDYQNKVPKAVIAGHMGYKGLNGGSLPVIAALGQYSLLEGRGDETCVSDIALKIVAHEPGESVRYRAMEEAASAPELFLELHKRFPNGSASDAAIRAHLLMSKFLPSATDTVIRSYRETMDLLNAEESAYKRQNPEAAFQVQMNEAYEDVDVADLLGQRARPQRSASGAEPRQEARSDVRREIITLDEGDVVISFPDALTADSVADLKDSLDLLIRRMQRRASSDKH